MKAKTNSTTNAEKGEELGEKSTTEKRAWWEAFWFSVPEQGTVTVENASYGPESHEHVHEVSVKHGSADSCDCKAYEYQDGLCKHMVAVNERPAVLAAATPAVDIEPTGTIDDVLPEANEDDSETKDTRVTDGTQETGPQDDCEDCIQGHACYEHWEQNQGEDPSETETGTGTNQPVMADGGQELTQLKPGQIFKDKTGTRWKLEQPVEHVDFADDGTEVACVRLEEVNGDGQEWIGCAKFPQLVNKPNGRYSLVGDSEDDDENERRTPRRSEPADFGHGESTGVQDLR